MKDKILKFEKKIKLKFNNLELLRQAFVHRSYLNENPKFKLNHNERLEFLGDAVLELVTTDLLFYKFPDKPEGDLTNIRASLVNSASLARTANNLEIDEFLYLSHGESKDKDSKARRYILANCIEAIIGAIYLDLGYNYAKKFIEEYIMDMLDEVIEKKLYMDPKTKFQEKSQENYNITPKYKLLEESGPDHKKTFIIGLYVDEKLISKGQGSSKQEAEVDAARIGLEKKDW
ncbi:ribonuclease III [bacterium]|nr:ribonuclease III [bacterium]